MKEISARAAAERLGVSVRRVQYLCRQRRIPGARCYGGRVWFLPENFTVTPATRGPKLGQQ